MPNIFVFFGSLILGATCASWSRSRDGVACALGIACGVTIAFATTDAWYLLALLVFGPLVWRRRKSPYDVK
jgi:hypothetical protein